MYNIILAGGHGTRLWPVSRKNTPKQSENFFDKKTLLQITHDRSLKYFKKEEIFISCGLSQYDILKKQVRDINKSNFILEPEPRGTAMAIGFACVKLLKKDKDAVLSISNSDHFIKQEEKYCKILKLGNSLIDKNPEKIVLVGIEPEYPETGYGYIEIGNLFNKISDNQIFCIKRFKEKPDVETAKEYIKSNKFFWNPAWFMFRADTMLSLFEKFLPKHFEALQNISKAIGTKNEIGVLKKEFKKVENISIDYGIMEKANNMLLIPSKITWCDVGHWRAVKDCFTKIGDDNLHEGNVLSVDSKDNLVINKNKDKLIAVLGVQNLVVVDTKDALFICPKNKSQEVKKIIDSLKNDKNLSKYL